VCIFESQFIHTVLQGGECNTKLGSLYESLPQVQPQPDSSQSTADVEDELLMLWNDVEQDGLSWRHGNSSSIPDAYTAPPVTGREVSSARVILGGSQSPFTHIQPGEVHQMDVWDDELTEATGKIRNLREQSTSQQCALSSSKHSLSGEGRIQQAEASAEAFKPATEMQPGAVQFTLHFTCTL
jgi:hypothetical protein